MSAPQTASSNLFDCRDAFSATLEALAENDPRIVIVVNDSLGSSKLNGFRKRFPERSINVGIAEQNMVGVGSGLANGGKIPFVSAASCFLTGRALEQIKADVAYSNANVKLIGQSPGVAYGELGPTHHSIEDMAWLRLLPNIVIVAPASGASRSGDSTVPAMPPGALAGAGIALMDMAYIAAPVAGGRLRTLAERPLQLQTGY